MFTKNERLIFIKTFLFSNKICSFKNLLNKLNCSVVTLRRDIRKLNIITSFTHNSIFLTLPAIPNFDTNGIWFFDNQVGFSKFNNSLNLIVNIINNKKTVITKNDIDKMLKIDIRKQISILLKKGKLNRIKVGNKYYYISKKLAENKIKRLKLFNVDELEEYYNDDIRITDLISVLKIVLQEYNINIVDIEKLIKKYSLNISFKKFEQLLIRYDLFKKKMQLNYSKKSG